jgi:hypothetical protein
MSSLNHSKSDLGLLGASEANLTRRNCNCKLQHRVATATLGCSFSSPRPSRRLELWQAPSQRPLESFQHAHKKPILSNGKSPHKKAVRLSLFSPTATEASYLPWRLQGTCLCLREYPADPRRFRTRPRPVSDLSDFPSWGSSAATGDGVRVRRHEC